MSEQLFGALLCVYAHSAMQSLGRFCWLLWAALQCFGKGD